MCTSGIDGSVKLWDMRKWECLKEWKMKKPVETMEFSQKGVLAIGWGHHVYVSVFLIASSDMILIKLDRPIAIHSPLDLPIQTSHHRFT
jgi:hypothetical protein